MRSRLACIALPCLIIAAASCGKSAIDTAQAFVPNKLPHIADIAFTLPAGVTPDTLGNNMTIRIAVTASDPENRLAQCLISSSQGTAGNIIATETGYTAEFITTAVTGGSAVTATITVRDEKGASDTWANHEIGRGRTKPTVIINDAPANLTREYMKPTDDTKFAFSCGSKGYYQVIADNAATESSIAIRQDDPIFMYTPSDDPASPKLVTVSIAGLLSTNSGKVKLSQDNAPNYVWLLFWDGLDQMDIKKFVINQDSLPPALQQITPTGDDVGTRTNIDVIFSEPVTMSADDISITDAADENAKPQFNEPQIAGNSILFAPKTELSYYEQYKVMVKAGARITDRAGNEAVVSALNGTFTTVALGTLAAPVFRNTDDSAVPDGHVYDYAASSTVHAVYAGSVDGVSVVTSSAVGSTPGDPSASYANSASIAVDFDRNTTIKAQAFKKGYKPSAVASIGVKMRTQTPAFSAAGSSAGDFYCGVYNSLDVTISGSGTITYAAQTDGAEPGTPSIVYSLTHQYSEDAHGYMVRYKARAVAANMEPSTVASGGPWKVRYKKTPKAAINASFYPSKMPWTAVAMSNDGATIVATENQSVQRGSLSPTVYGGYIWISKDSGLNWRASDIPNSISTQAWSCVAVSADASCMVAGAAPGQLFSSENGGGWWSTNGSTSANWSGVAVDSLSSTCYAIAPGQTIKKSVKYGSPPTRYPWAVTSQSSPEHSWRSIALSYPGPNPTGHYPYVIENNNNHYWMLPSENSLWDENKIFSDSFNCITSGNKNSIVAISSNPGYIYTRIGDAASFDNETLSGNKNWSCIAITPNQTHCMAGVENGSLWYIKPGNSAAAVEKMSFSPKQWKGIAASRVTDGLMAAIAYNDYLYTSGDLFTNHQVQGPRLWTSVALSPSGEHLAAAMYNGEVYVSHDYGYTWTKLANPASGNTQWVGVAISADGTKLAAVDTLHLFVWSGSAWLEKANDGFTGVTMSADGSIMVACASYYYMTGISPKIYTSVNSGLSWNSETIIGQPKWRGCSASSDATVLAVIMDTVYDADKTIRIKKNGVWNNYAISGVTSLSGVSVSPDGQCIAVCSSNGFIHVSSDGGLNWASVFNDALRRWRGVSISNGGQVITALTADGAIWTSYNGGVTMSSQIEWGDTRYAGNEMWSSIAASADGLNIIAASFGGRNPVILR